MVRRLFTTLFKETKFIVTFCIFSGIVYMRTLQSLYFVTGAVNCVFLAKFLQQVLRQPRPNLPAHAKYHSKYGMPSAHAQLMTFVTIYFNLSLLEAEWSHMQWLLIPINVSYLSNLYARSNTGRHTYAQILVGILAGLVFGGLWYTCWSRYWGKIAQEYTWYQKYGDISKLNVTEYVSVYSEKDY
ncbi:hypothetical protein K7432_001087 [Basidiobolus ranarum]|uniref:Phosphatidic acid phosphatase type 2/haloperoxidase domain-containing protein n=1 Tax=Basidiobolus ranarum TaxID=34480 RepID=A0ABR2X3M4_9FUNG